MLTSKQRKLAFSGFYLIYFTDLLAWSIVLMIFAPLIIPSTSSLLSADVTLEKRNLLLGVLIGIYPLMQFFAAPILGGLSDHYGRRKVLLFSTFGSFISLILSALAITASSLSLLLFSRIIAGVCAGNMTLSQAGVADLTTEDERGRYMAIFTIVSGLGWILGPYVGSQLSRFTFATPFWLVSLLFLLSFLIIFFAYKETFTPAENKLSLSKAFSDLTAVFKLPQIVKPFVTFSLVYFGWSLFLSFFSALLIEKYQLEKVQIGYLFVYASFWFFIGGVFCNQWLLKKHTAQKSILLPGVILGLVVIAATFFPSAIYFWPMLTIAATCCAIVTTCLFTLNSTLTPATMQGRLFGAINAMFSLCFAVSPLLSGWLANFWVGLPILTGGIFLLIASGVYWRWLRMHEE